MTPLDDGGLATEVRAGCGSRRVSRLRFDMSWISRVLQWPHLRQPLPLVTARKRLLSRDQTERIQIGLCRLDFHLCGPILRKSSVIGKSGFSSTGGAGIAPGVCPKGKNRATRRASASLALTGNVAKLRPPGCAT